ncbi:signal peptide [Streptococcus macacae NCTC 11558]|nr:signal peptide [Streptococcus macacae NCTC 11558]
MLCYSNIYNIYIITERYVKVAKNHFNKALEYEVWSDNKKPIKASELKYRNSKENRRVKLNDLVTDDKKMKNVGRKFLIFPDWRVAVKPSSAEISINTKDLDLYINNKKVAKTDSDSYTKKITRLYPGTYNFTVKGKVSNQDVEVSSEQDLLGENKEVDLDVEYLSFKVNSNLKDGDLYIGSQRIGKLKDGQYNISKMAVTNDAKVFVQKSFPGKPSLKSEVKSIQDIYDGDTITLDAEGVLEHKTAVSLITGAYNRLSSYAASHRTPDNLDEVFSGGDKNSFYTDVKNNIDTNTTEAKNRSADSILYSDINVTKITQTSPTTYTVDFTVIYNFSFMYDSEHETSGNIKQKLSWSANVSYNRDEDDDEYSFYKDYKGYRITSSNGKSKVLETKNTVK